MKSICFIIPWIGKLPNYFQLWIESCRYNPSIDFLLITDDYTQFEYPPNIKVIYMEFDELRRLVQNSFDFPISLERPYKLCDFRPAFGEVFSGYIQEYDFWGHCDIDIIWGNIRSFLTDDKLALYDKFFSRGHCSLYRNIPNVNSWYRTLPNFGCQNWKEVFQSSRACCYDEWAGHCGGGISEIVKQCGMKVFDPVYTADINVKRGRFVINRMEDFGDLYFHYVKGSLYIKNNLGVEREVMCVHFQKRNLIISKDLKMTEFFLIAPNLVSSDISEIKKYSIIQKKYEAKQLLDRIKRKLRVK